MNSDTVKVTTFQEVVTELHMCVQSRGTYWNLPQILSRIRMVGPDDLRGLFQLQQFYDSISHWFYVSLSRSFVFSAALACHFSALYKKSYPLSACTPGQSCFVRPVIQKYTNWIWVYIKDTDIWDTLIHLGLVLFWVVKSWFWFFLCSFKGTHKILHGLQ